MRLVRKCSALIATFAIIALAMAPANAGSADSATIKTASTQARNGLFSATEVQFNLNNCSDQGLSLQGTDAYVINLWADGFVTDTLSIAVSTLGTPEASVPAAGLVESVTVRYYSQFCGNLKSDFAAALPYTGWAAGAKWAVVTFSTGAMINFHWSTTNVPL